MTELYPTPRPLANYLDRAFSCPCGRTHYAPLKAVEIGPGALEGLPALLNRLGFHRPYLICDSITQEIAGDRALKILQQAGVAAYLHCLTHSGFDEATLGELVIHMPEDCDLAVAVGTGSINDMTRYFSFRMGRPFLTIATAAPMDGFASSIAALNVDNMKTTFQAQTPTAILGDTDILKGAPYSMIAAGLGDLLGKSTCLCDWKLSHLINGEQYCPRIVELVEHSVSQVLKDAPRAKERDPKVLGDIMEGLVLTGVAMSLYGSSRPASGCEHHISHCWEMLFAQKGRRLVPHGIQVGVGTVLILRLVEAFLRQKVDFCKARAAARTYDPAAWAQEIFRVYGPAAPGVLQLEEQSQKNEIMGRLTRIDAMESNWPQVIKLLEALPASSQVAGLLTGLDSPCRPEQIGVDPSLLRDTLLYSKETRARYTILQLLWDLGVLEELADQLIEER